MLRFISFKLTSSYIPAMSRSTRASEKLNIARMPTHSTKLTFAVLPLQIRQEMMPLYMNHYLRNGEKRTFDFKKYLTPKQKVCWATGSDTFPRNPRPLALRTPPLPPAPSPKIERCEPASTPLSHARARSKALRSGGKESGEEVPRGEEANTAVKRKSMRNALVTGRRPRKFPAPKFN